MGTIAHLIDDAAGIDPAWLEGVGVIGLTAGASAPHHLVEQVIDFLRTRGPVRIRERVALAENNSFILPKQVRRQSKAPEDGPAS
jgi:4-hydroxy-3-methylbut-2-enyl diphosphate reductase